MTTYTKDFDSLIQGPVRTAEVVLTGGVAYHRGDLLVVTEATNVVVKATSDTYATARYIMPCDMTATAATAHVASGYQFAVFSDGDFDQSKVLIDGTALTSAQVLAAKAPLEAKGIQLRVVR